MAININYKFISVMIALSKANKENGCLAGNKKLNQNGQDKRWICR